MANGVTFTNALPSWCDVTVQPGPIASTIFFRLAAHSSVVQPAIVPGTYSTVRFATNAKVVTVDELRIDTGDVISVTDFIPPPQPNGHGAHGAADVPETSVRLVNDTREGAQVRLQAAPAEALPTLVVPPGAVLELLIAKAAKHSFTATVGGRVARIVVKASRDPLVLYLSAIFPSELPAAVQFFLEDAPTRAAPDAAQPLVPPFKAGLPLESYV
ncbi:hypothetical protein PsYK624_109200 [Phanerochaete sordida]|uniref:Uncharacterized protein n=1 Tax=Phanerochaete sordida TaxID=48140 RepID=A0A9P3GGZ5_9APHY|nr:hypothetical protein PsYK624_109200 [Phanerochaete sordida]